jgi:hypothetical protein
MGIQQIQNNESGSLVRGKLNTVIDRVNEFTNLTGSLATTGSNIFVGNQIITGSLNINSSSTFTTIFATNITGSNISASGTITANTFSGGSFSGTTITASGNAKLGDATVDAHTVTGSFGISGSFAVNGASTLSVVTASGLSVTGNVGIGTTTPTSKLYVSGSTIIQSSGSIVFDIQGSQGQLFSVIDLLTGSLMSVNNISGLPILEVFSDDKVVMGTFGAEGLIVTGSNVNIGKIVTNSHTVTGTTTVSGSLIITGSTYRNVNNLTVTSNTASINMSSANFFTLTLPTGSTTHLNATNIGFGQTISLLIRQAAVGTGSLSFAPVFKFPTGSLYTPSSATSAEDVITFVTFNTTGSIYGTSIKNLI